MDQIIIKKLTEEEIEKMGIREWPIWEKEISNFDWHYDQDEQCLLLEGKVAVETKSGTVEFQAGDFVHFKAGLSCSWDVQVPVRKHYRFL